MTGAMDGTSGQGERREKKDRAPFCKTEQQPVVSREGLSGQLRFQLLINALTLPTSSALDSKFRNLSPSDGFAIQNTQRRKSTTIAHSPYPYSQSEVDTHSQPSGTVR